MFSEVENRWVHLGSESKSESDNSNPESEDKEWFSSSSSSSSSNPLGSTSTHCLLETGKLSPKCSGRVVMRSFALPGLYKFKVVGYSYTLSGNGDKNGRGEMEGSFRVIYPNYKSSNHTSSNTPPHTSSNSNSNNNENKKNILKRREFRTLSQKEWTRFVEALYSLKRWGMYDMLVAVHKQSMQFSYSSTSSNNTMNDNNNSSSSSDNVNGGDVFSMVNLSHGSPAFLPWHRLFTLVLERTIQMYVTNLNQPSHYKSSSSKSKSESKSSSRSRSSMMIGIPFWDWSYDRTLPQGQASSPIWTAGYMGTLGDFFTTIVQDGPFCGLKSVKCSAKWQLREDLDGPVLKRRVGYLVPVVPSREYVQHLMHYEEYDVPTSPSSLDNSTNSTNSSNSNFDSNDSNLDSNSETVIEEVLRRNSTGFRPALEGLTAIGHNSVHMFVGGGMILSTSPNDPLFYLHHSFTDKLFLDWQTKVGCFSRACWDRSHWSGVRGQRWGDSLWPWDISVGDMFSKPTSYEYQEFTG